MLPEVTRINKHGKGLCLYLSTAIRANIQWNAGDRIAVRPAGDKLILERVPLEQLSKFRTSEVEPR